MPVYLRKNVVFTPPSLAEMPVAEDEDDYITDPDQFKDNLPQPYRMINKIVFTLFDSAWMSIAGREENRIAEAAKIRPPQYECGISIDIDRTVAALSSTPDGRYVIVGLEDGIAVIEADSQQVTTSWKDDKMHIVSLHIIEMQEDINIIDTVDDMGVGRIFGFCHGSLFLLFSGSDSQGESNKALVTKCQSSCKGDFFGLAYENQSTKESWLEFHKVPKDTWIKEMESEANKAARAAAKAASPQPETGSNLEYAQTNDSVIAGNEEPRAQDIEADVSSRSSEHLNPTPNKDELENESPGSQRDGSSPAPEKNLYKFATPNLVLKVRCPSPLTGISYSTVYQASKTIDSSGDVIGSGHSHLLSAQYLEHSKNMFESLNQEYMMYVPKDKQTMPVSATFHFLAAGRQMNYGMDQTPISETTSSVMIHWGGSSQVFYYSLVKPSKASHGVAGKKKQYIPPSQLNAAPDVEHKADMIWPMSEAVVHSTCTPCTSLVAFALKDGNIVIWDKHMGIPRRIHHVPHEINQISFVDPSICPQIEPMYQPYKTNIHSYLHVVCKNGKMFLINTGLSEQTMPRQICDSKENEQDLFSKVIPLSGIPELVVTCRHNGKVYLQDILSGKELCEITLPSNFELTSPWEPAISVGANGQMLYIKGTCKDKPEPQQDLTFEEGEGTENVIQNVYGLFVFTLRSFPALDSYREKTRKQLPFIVHNTVTDRVGAILKNRLNDQPMRKTRMQTRWSQMKNELEMIQLMQQDAKKRREQSAYSTVKAV